MSDPSWKELWLKNYRGEGDTQDLEKFLKTLDFGSKNNIPYLPWAVVQRIFELQGGTTEVLDGSQETSVVWIDSCIASRSIDENGQIEERILNSYFIRVKAIWQGREYIEKYPMQNSSNKALSYWDQNDLNRITQRAKVKAIGECSGIGYKLFESGDLQFDEDPNKKQETPSTQTPTTSSPSNKKKTPAKQVDVMKDEKLDEAKETEAQPQEEQKETPIPNVKEEAVVEDEDLVSPKQTGLSTEEMIEFIKKTFIAAVPEKVSAIQTFLKSKGKKRLSELTPEETLELYTIVK